MAIDESVHHDFYFQRSYEPQWEHAKDDPAWQALVADRDKFRNQYDSYIAELGQQAQGGTVQIDPMKQRPGLHAAGAEAMRILYEMAAIEAQRQKKPLDEQRHAGQAEVEDFTARLQKWTERGTKSRLPLTGRQGKAMDFAMAKICVQYDDHRAPVEQHDELISRRNWLRATAAGVGLGAPLAYLASRMAIHEMSGPSAFTPEMRAQLAEVEEKKAALWRDESAWTDDKSVKSWRAFHELDGEEKRLVEDPRGLKIAGLLVTSGVAAVASLAGAFKLAYGVEARRHDAAVMAEIASDLSKVSGFIGDSMQRALAQEPRGPAK